MTNEFAVVLGAIGTFVAGIFGKEGWNYLTRKKELETDSLCQKKIRALEIKLAEEVLKTNQIVTGVDMLLTIFEGEFGADSKYQDVIDKVREFITVDKKEENV